MIDLSSDYIYFDGKKYVDISDDIFMAVSAIICDFAYNSRIDSGYRLLERCLRHSFDSKTNDLQKAAVKFIRHNASGKLGLVFNHNVHASMKNISYKTENVATAEDIIIYKCT